MSLKYFTEDIKLNSSSDRFIVKFKHLVVSHSLHMIFLIRLGQSIRKVPFIGSILRVFLEYFVRILYSSDISCCATIGPGLMIVHGHDIVIGADVVIGKNCKIFNGVTFGNKDLSATSKGSQPTVGHNCVFCTGAKILGPLIVGDNVIVGANAVLLNDCEPNSIYGGVPAKFIKVNK